MVVRPSLTTWSEMQTDHVILKVLDTNSIRVISSVLGQSVALDSYARFFPNQAMPPLVQHRHSI